mmetsp:Transcript_21597/g.31946  ORF Transcript_21597/g.31946 Transcript_21597/m.31946 type:complete len:254 (+) Transcript_21597:101-862(+)|eukprot:CAMPEP_0194204838 /NCGR_PEP_ID=MMETSP0156-20130528/4261_1 /TAXON_ID=33649 /ORGANISM="Thalassionema nitzschioides, Strain L26-B" /LENGTH=253 /DNA_ID=CAMNT_0038930955 /DNA_START=52 /DNA_END=813 /DNA_ORIENTATION=+
MLLDDYLPPDSNHNIDEQDMSNHHSLSSIPRDVLISDVSQQQRFKKKSKETNSRFDQKLLSTPLKQERQLDNGGPLSVNSTTSNESSTVSTASKYEENNQRESECYFQIEEDASNDSMHEHLVQELKGLQAVLKKKDEQIVHLMGQLGRATASKCDLVVACNDMERQKSLAERYGRDADTVLKVKHDYQKIVESRAEMEQHFMNELATLTEATCKMERRYLNIICEKDFEIAQLQESQRRLSMTETLEKTTAN